MPSIFRICSTCTTSFIIFVLFLCQRTSNLIPWRLPNTHVYFKHTMTLTHKPPHPHVRYTATHKMYLHGLRQKQWGESLCLLLFQIVLYCSVLRKFSLSKKEPVVLHLGFRDDYAKNTDPVYSLFFQKQLCSWITSDKAALPTFTLSPRSWSHTRLDNMLIPGLYGEILY